LVLPADSYLEKVPDESTRAVHSVFQDEIEAAPPKMSHHLPSARFATLYPQRSSNNAVPPSRHKKYRAQNVLAIDHSNTLSSHVLRPRLDSSSSYCQLCQGRDGGLQARSLALPAVPSAVGSGTFASSKPDSMNSAAQLENEGFQNYVMLSKRLRSFRLQQNVSLIELANKSRVPFQVLADYEQGWQQPDQTTLQRLALALGVQITELLSIATR